MIHISEKFASPNCPVLIKDSDGVPLRIYASTGALLDPLGNTVTDSTGLLSVWVNSESQPVVTLLSSSGTLDPSNQPRPAAQEEVAIGEIRYFASPPADPAWLKCDGAPYLRSAYPEYEGMRPDLAFVAQTYTIPLHVSSGSVWTGQYFIKLVDNSRDVLRSTDGITWETLSAAFPQDASWVSQLTANGTTGHILALDNGVVSLSLDHGATWSAGGTLPTGTIIDGFPVWIRAVVSPTFGFVTVKACSNVLAHSLTGAAWTGVEIPGPAYTWETLVSLGSDQVFSTPSVPGVIYDFYPSQVDRYIYTPQVGAFHDVHGRLTTQNTSYGVSFSQFQKQAAIFEISTWAFSQATYDLPINPFGIACVELLGNTAVSVVFSDLLILDAETGEFSYIDGIIPGTFTNAFTTSASSGSVAVFSNYYGETVRISLDPLKFNAPGLSPKAGATPYVYTGG